MSGKGGRGKAPRSCQVLHLRSMQKGGRMFYLHQSAGHRTSKAYTNVADAPGKQQAAPQHNRPRVEDSKPSGADTSGPVADM